MALLEVENLQTHFRTPDGVVRAVDGVSFAVEGGETVAIVGESGSGKSVTANSILRLVAQPPGKIAGRIRFEGEDLLALSERDMRADRAATASGCPVLQMIADVEAERDATVKEAAPQHPNADKIKALAALSSIGPEFATRLVGEVFYRSFANRRQLAGFAGIAPSPWSSGSIERDQGISKAGSSLVRTTMIELGWMWLRYQPGSALSIWFRDRVGDQKGRVRRIAIVALARKLLVALWRYLETGLVPTGAVFKAR
jgi:transposase